MRPAVRKLLHRVGWGLAVVILWHLSVVVLDVPSYVVPSPVRVALTFWVDRTLVLSSAWVTLLEASAGLFVALVVTTLLGVLFAISTRTERLLSPPLVGIQSVPVLALAPLLTLWFGTGVGSKIAASLLVCFFPLVTGWSAGISSVQQEERDLFATFGASRLQLVKFLVIPRALPYFFAGLKVSAPLAIVGAIVGEFVGASSGLGYLVLSSSYYVRTDRMFAAIVTISACSIAAFRCVDAIQRHMLFWHGSLEGEAAPRTHGARSR